MIKSKQVDSPEKFAEYVQQRTGTPYPTRKDLIILKKKCNEFFEHYPNLDYGTLCRTADWCKSKKRRFARVWAVVEQFRYAYRAGVLPEVDQARITDDDVEKGIQEALGVEEDDIWRSRLIASQGRSLRKEVLEKWQEIRAAS